MTVQLQTSCTIKFTSSIVVFLKCDYSILLGWPWGSQFCSACSCLCWSSGRYRAALQKQRQSQTSCAYLPQFQPSSTLSNQQAFTCIKEVYTCIKSRSFPILMQEQVIRPTFRLLDNLCTSLGHPIRNLCLLTQLPYPIMHGECYTDIVRFL